MKVGILSDIHVDMNYREYNKVEDAIIETIKLNGIDILIIGGDVSGDYEHTLKVLNDLEEKTSVKVLFVPGNHDIWNKNHKDKTTWEIYEKLKSFKGNLSRGNLVIGDWAFVGDIGWYDYSFGSKEHTIEEFEEGIGYGTIWSDKIHVDWGKSDIEMSDYFYRKLKKDLELVKDKKIIFVTHMVIHDYAIVPEIREMWKFFNGFLGSNRYLTLIKDYNIRYAIMGHVHYRRSTKEGDAEYICNCLNYRRQWYNKDDAFREVERAMYIIEI